MIKNWKYFVTMKALFLAVICFSLAFAADTARAQVAPSATSGTFSISAGGEGSASQPDYAGNGIAQTSPNRLYGIGAYVDVRFSRWVQIEAEGRWLNFNESLPNGASNGEETYLIGPRIPILHYRRFTPYGKALIGFSSGTFLNGHATAIAYGGGLDYQLTRRFTIRAADVEFQDWRVTPSIYPYGVSAGLSYRIF